MGDVSELALKIIHLQPLPFFNRWRYAELPALQRHISVFRHRTLSWAALRLAGPVAACCKNEMCLRGRGQRRMYSIPWRSDRGKELPLREQTQAEGQFGVLTANTHPLGMGGVGRADGIQGVLWIRLASAAVLEAEPFPGRIWQEQ